MTRTVLILIITSANCLFGQKTIIRDSLSNIPIENVNLNFKNSGISSNENGIVDISLFDNENVVEISHISYNTKKIIKKKIGRTIYLSKKTFVLPPIVLRETSKIPISDKHMLFKINPVGFLKLESSTANLLSSQSSLVVQENQSGGGSPNYRGMEANRLLLIVDEIALNNAIFRSGHLQNSATINPFFIKSVSLITGPASVAYGDGAMGGALIFRTLEPVDNNNFIFYQQFESSSNTVISNFRANYYLNNHSHISAFSLKSAGNLKMGNRRYHGYSNWGNEKVSHNKNEQLYTNYSQADFMHKSKYKVNNNNSFVLNTQYSISSNIYRFDKMNDMQDGFPKYKNWYYGPQIRFSQQINYNSSYKNIFFDNLRALIAFQNIKESRHTQRTGEELLNNRNENVTIYDYNIDLKKKYKNIELAYGAGTRKQNISSTANLSNKNSTFYNTTRYPDGGSNVQDFFTYSQINISFIKKLSLIIGGRWNRSKLIAKFNNPSFIFENVKNATFSFVKSALISFSPINNTIINAAYYGGFRSPNIDDLGKVFSKDDVNVIVPNANLNPEYADNIELSIYYVSEQFNLQAQIFNIQISNAINRGYGSLNGVDSMMYDSKMMRIQMNKNIESATINGISFAADFNASDNLKIAASCNQLIGKTNKNTSLAHIPPFNAKISFTYKLNKNVFNLYSNYNGWKLAENYDESGVDNIEEATNDGNPSWFTLNFAYGNNINNDIKFTFAIKNILDAHYKTFGSGLSASGRNFIIGIETLF